MTADRRARDFACTKKTPQGCYVQTAIQGPAGTMMQGQDVDPAAPGRPGDGRVGGWGGVAGRAPPLQLAGWQLVARPLQREAPGEAAGVLLNSAIIGNMGEGRCRNARVSTHADFINEKPGKYLPVQGPCGKERNPMTGPIFFFHFEIGAR